MQWYHECSLSWLIARQNFLTATDIYDLLTVTPTGRKRNITIDNYLKVIARKEERLTADNCISTGTAARGHILEPYAIEMFNESQRYEDKLYHWDDALITQLNAVNGLAYSPDALDIEQDDSFDIVNYTLDIEPKVLGEVKSYNVEKHLICGYKDKMKLEERWQIAVAMAVSESIERAYLLFYNPSLKRQLFVKQYARDDLANEIEIVKYIEAGYIKKKQEILFDDSIIVGSFLNEELIYKEFEEAKRLNP